MSSELSRKLSEALGQKVVRLSPIAGGDINEAFRAELAGGTSLFVKTRAHAPANMYVREAEGLEWLRAAGSLRVPEVVLATQAFLALEWIETRGRARDFDEQLGRGLAALHRACAPHFGLSQDNFIGPLVQPNQACADWSAFYWERRIAPLLARASARGLIAGALTLRFEELRERLNSLVGPDEPPSRLHGDLWTGNVHSDEHGAPVLIDPAVYGGHREVDLAMLALFGSPPTERFLRAYDEVYARAPGVDDRVTLYQLYPLLVHVCLFGTSYVSQLRHALERCLAT